MRHRLAAAAIACAALFGIAASPAGAATASQTVNAGSLAFLNSTPGNVVFPATTLDGTDQVRTQSQAIDVGDATGSSAGWAITATSTLFTAAPGRTLDPASTTIQTAPTRACIAASTCTLANNAIPYPYTLPAGATAPTATKMYNAAANSGMGNQTVTPTWSLALPATTWAGGGASPYTATWTFTLVSGP